MSAQAPSKKPYRLDPCPAAERVEDCYDVPDAYQVATRETTDRDVPDETGITYERCGGGRRVVKKRIGGN